MRNRARPARPDPGQPALPTPPRPAPPKVNIARLAREVRAQEDAERKRAADAALTAAGLAEPGGPDPAAASRGRPAGCHRPPKPRTYRSLRTR